LAGFVETNFAATAQQDWHKDSFRGGTSHGIVASAHQTTLTLREVDGPDGWRQG
jgi:hypothetical protein